MKLEKYEGYLSHRDDAKGPCLVEVEMPVAARVVRAGVYNRLMDRLTIYAIPAVSKRLERRPFLLVAAGDEYPFDLSQIAHVLASVVPADAFCGFVVHDLNTIPGARAHLDALRAKNKPAASPGE